MTLSDFIQHLDSLNEIVFYFTNEEPFPPHYHITEAGLVTKKYLDCTGTCREENFFHIQLWIAEDIHHRIKPGKWKNILSLAQRKCDFEGTFLPVRIELQGKRSSEWYNPSPVMKGFQLNPVYCYCADPKLCIKK